MDMSDQYLVEPDLKVISEIIGMGGNTLKKCFQCASCSVVCPLSPDVRPFPRKEMIAASWGLKDRLIKNPDIWLCYRCGECSIQCPRGARPSDVLAAIRSYAISQYALPGGLARAVNDRQNLPLLLAVPAILFAVLAFVTVRLGEDMTAVFQSVGLTWRPGGEQGVIAHADFFSTWFVDLVFIPLAGLVTLIFALGLYRLLTGIHEQALQDGRSRLGHQGFVALASGTVRGIVARLNLILKHSRFTECAGNKGRATAHMMVLYGFIGLFIMTTFGFIMLYLFNQPGPYSQWYPFKMLANAAGISLVMGGLLMIKNRLAEKDQASSYQDWLLIGLVLGLGASGMLTELTRLLEAKSLTYFMYYIHLIFVFCAFAYLPFSKLAHLVYRTVALGYAEYAGREK